MSLREKLLSSKPKTKEITAGGQPLTIKGMTAAERRLLREKTKDASIEELHAWVTVISVVDNGKQIFTEDDINQIVNEMDFAILEDVFRESMSINSVEEGAIEAAEKK